MSKRILYAGIAVFLSIGAPSAHANREVGILKEDQVTDSKKQSKKNRTTYKHLSFTRASEEQKDSLKKIREHVWYLQKVMEAPLTTHLPHIRRQLSSAENEREKYRVLLDHWDSLAARVWQEFQSPPNYSNWLCIQRHETAPPYPSWRTNSGNDFYGGVQMNLQFMKNYGSFLLALKGTADKWTKLEQIWVAERGRQVQGWGAWPHSSIACGLS